MTLRSVIDVGTNSVKVLLGAVTGREVVPVWETSRQTRLGQGFYEDHRLQSGPIESTAVVVAAFAEEARKRGAVSVRVIATSAAREASNAHELLEAIQRTSGLACEVIPGALEAEWGFGGVTTNPLYASQRLLVLDVGGGSTEFILGHHGHARFSESYPMGSVRLFERFQPSESPHPDELGSVRSYVRDFVTAHVKPHLQPFFDAEGSPEMAVGIGGTTSILAMIQLGTCDFDRELIERTQFTLVELRALNERLWSLPLAERRRLPGLPSERADVILTGTTIYEGILEVMNLQMLGISTRGLRFAALLDSRNS